MKIYYIILCYIISYYVMLCFTLRFIFTFIVIFYYFLFCFVIFDGSKIVGIRFSRVLAAIIFQVYIYTYTHDATPKCCFLFKFPWIDLPSGH